MTRSIPLPDGWWTRLSRSARTAPVARLGGAQQALLADARADASRFFSMGSVLIGTAFMAAASATFALITAVRLPVVVAVLVGLIWGLLILNLDRMLVISMGRRRGFWPNVAIAAPRVLLALLIGAVISVPLVLRIFQPEVDNELQVMHAENLIANQKKLDEEYADIPPLQQRVDQLQAVASGRIRPGVADDPDVRTAQQHVDAAQAAFTKSSDEAQCELNGLCGTGHPGEGDAYRAAKARADQAHDELNAANADLARAQDAARTRFDGSAVSDRDAAARELGTVGPRLEQREAEQVDAQRRLDSGEENNEGLLARLEALDRLSADTALMWFAHWTLAGLFAAVELLPVITKTLTNSGPKTLYEQIVESREGDVRDAEQNRSDRIRGRAAEWRAHEDITRDMRLELVRYQADQQKVMGQAATDGLVQTQRELMERAVETWAAVARTRTDEQLADWYQRHSRPTAAAPGSSANGFPPDGVSSNGAVTVPLNIPVQSMPTT